MTHSIRPIPPASRPAAAPRKPGREALTLRQAAIVEQLARGLSTAEAADRLGLSVHTVRFHLNIVYHTLGLTHRGELVLWAVDHGFGGAR